MTDTGWLFIVFVKMLLAGPASADSAFRFPLHSSFFFSPLFFNKPFADDYTLYLLIKLLLLNPTLGQLDIYAVHTHTNLELWEFMTINGK